MKPFELLNEIKQERQNQQKKLDEMKSRRDTAIDELKELEEQYKVLVRQGAATKELDKLLDSIDTATKLADRRANEYEMFKQVTHKPTYSSDDIYNAFREYTEDFIQEELPDILEQMEQLTEQYLQLQEQLLEKIAFHKGQQQAADNEMKYYVRQFGGVTRTPKLIKVTNPFVLRPNQIKTFYLNAGEVN